MPFGRSSISSTEPFSLIHCDIWGPHKVTSHSGARYFLTIVDDYTCCTWLYLMRFKYETQPLLKSFVRTQFNCDIKAICVDNGSEFASMRPFFMEHGILYQTTCVYTPQQNGVVERKHHHILNVACALRFHSNVSLIFWGECVLTATYLINCMPTPLLSGKSPYELLYDRAPSLDHL